MPPRRVRFAPSGRNRPERRASNTREAKVVSESTAGVLVAAFGVYATAGVLFAIAFVWQLAGRLDPAAQRGTVGFRLVVFPGVAALWPYLLGRLITGASAPPDEWNAHRRRAR
jgi:hypothetical protein